jgi:hypothetical protein
MNTWAVLAAKDAVLASGLGAGAAPLAGIGSIDSFAIGVALSGTCMLILTTPRRRRHQAAVAEAGRVLPRRRRSALATRTLADATREVFVPAPLAPDDSAPPDVPVAPGVPAAPVAPDAQAAPDEPWYDEAGSARPERREAAGRDYQSKHRLAGPAPAETKPEGRSKPRHAAPAASVSVRLTRLLAVRPIASGAHA